MSVPVPDQVPSKRSRWYLFFTLLLAAVLLFLAIRGVSWADVIATLRQVEPASLALALGFSVTALFVRGLRWGVLLSAEQRIAPLTMFWATAIGYLGNTLLPARAGELLRSATLGRKTGLGVSTVLATALTERVIDALALVLIGLLALHGTGQALPAWLFSAMRVMLVLGLAAIVFLGLAPRLQGVLTRLVALLPLPEGWRVKLARLLDQFLVGARAFVHPGRAAGFLGLTALIWLVDGLGTMQVAHAMQLSLTLAQAELLLVALGLSSAVPSTPGYVGVFQFVAVTLLPVFGFRPGQALTFILVMQSLSLLLVTLSGVLGLWQLREAKK